MELKGPLAKPPVIDRIGAVPIPPPNPFREEELDYSGTNIPYKYRGLGDVEFRADIQKHVKNDPTAILALADIERRFKGDYGKAIDMTPPGIHTNLKGKPIRVGVYDSDGDPVMDTDPDTGGGYGGPGYRRDEYVAQGLANNVDDIPAIQINTNSKYDPMMSLRHELDHYGIDMLTGYDRIGLPYSIYNKRNYDEITPAYFGAPSSNLNPEITKLINDMNKTYPEGFGEDEEHNLVEPLDYLQGRKLLENGKSYSHKDADAAAELAYELDSHGHSHNDNVNFRRRIDALALKRLEELGIPKTPTNLLKLTWLDRVLGMVGLKDNEQPRFEYGL